MERQDDNSCEVTWEALPPMKGDPILYTLQCMMGNSEFKQVLLTDGLAFRLIFMERPAADQPLVTVAD